MLLKRLVIMCLNVVFLGIFAQAGPKMESLPIGKGTIIELNDSLELSLKSDNEDIDLPVYYKNVELYRPYKASCYIQFILPMELINQYKQNGYPKKVRFKGQRYIITELSEDMGGLHFSKPGSLDQNSQPTSLRYYFSIFCHNANFDSLLVTEDQLSQVLEKINGEIIVDSLQYHDPLPVKNIPASANTLLVD